MKGMSSLPPGLFEKGDTYYRIWFNTYQTSFGNVGHWSTFDGCRRDRYGTKWKKIWSQCLLMKDYPATPGLWGASQILFLTKEDLYGSLISRHRMEHWKGPLQSCVFWKAWLDVWLLINVYMYELPYKGQLGAWVLEPFIYNRNMWNVLEKLVFRLCLFFLFL